MLMLDVKFREPRVERNAWLLWQYKSHAYIFAIIHSGYVFVFCVFLFYTALHCVRGGVELTGLKPNP